MRLTKVFPVTAFVYFASLIISAGCSCSGEQRTNCLRAAKSGNLRDLEAGGTCLAKQYVHFTHVCTVSNYLPNVDYCCCSHDSNVVMCCLYHQDWDFFRCLESNDTIESTRWEFFVTPKKVLLFAMSLPVLLLVSFVIFCVRKQRCNRANEENSASGNCSLICCRCSSTCGYELATESNLKPQSIAGESKRSALNSYFHPPSVHVSCLADDPDTARNVTELQCICHYDRTAPANMWLFHPTEPSYLPPSKHSYVCCKQFKVVDGTNEYSSAHNSTIISAGQSVETLNKSQMVVVGRTTDRI